MQNHLDNITLNIHLDSHLFEIYLFAGTYSESISLLVPANGLYGSCQSLKKLLKKV